MGKKIMVVDDAMIMRKVICKNLQECGYTDIIEACDGEKALEMYACLLYTSSDRPARL